VACANFIGQMDDIYEELKDQGYESWAILIYDQNGEPPTKEYCKAYRDGYGLKMRVLYDPNGATKMYGDKETSIVSNEAGIIVYEAHSDLPIAIRQAVEDELKAGYGECSDPAVCGDEYCAPTPVGDTKICAPMCTFGDDSTCPQGEVCYRYDDSKENGFCFTPDLIP